MSDFGTLLVLCEMCSLVPLSQSASGYSVPLLDTSQLICPPREGGMTPHKLERREYSYIASTESNELMNLERLAREF